MRQVILEVKNLRKEFRTQKKNVYAVNDVSFNVLEGETFGIVGESGCGKTTCGKTSIGMLSKTDGQVLYKGKDVHAMSKKEHYEFTKEVQMIFQDPYASLDPKMKVYDIVAEGIRIHKLAKSTDEESRQVAELLRLVGLNAEQGNRYVHEFSGGQRQRIGIARALAVNPKFLLCDEPISALDVSIQAQIVNMLKDIQKERNLSMIFIGHDLSMVRYISDRIAVMYLGKIVEMGEADQICIEPKHPYTQALLSVIPIPDPEETKKRESILLEGDIPNPTEVIQGCVFCNRCKYVSKRCMAENPELKEISAGHCVACHMV